jgi:NAD(P)-dependent dehydrogenase (short-subunit alcohol dehydrogenase family)
MRLDGRVILITGAGSGIGAATARRLAVEGAAVALVGRTAATLEAVAAEIVASGGRALALPADVALADQIEAAMARTLDHFGQLDGLVANAAVQLHRRDRPLEDLSEAAWDETQAINLRGVYLTCRAGLRPLLGQGRGGSIVIVSSVTALAGIAPQNPAYTASKGGLVALGRAMAVQYGPVGIRVNIVCPGALEATPDFEQHPDPAGRQRRLSEQIPLGRLGRFAELAPMIAFLLSDDASYASGGLFVVDGGLTAR